MFRLAYKTANIGQSAKKENATSVSTRSRDYTRLSCYLTNRSSITKPKHVAYEFNSTYEDFCY